MTALLEVTGLTVRYGGIRALDGANLNVLEQGAIYGIIGPNGAGKSTLFNVVSGLVRPNKGTITFAGHDITRLRPEEIARLGVGRTFQTPRAFPSLSLIDNLCVSASHKGESLQGALLGGYAEAEEGVRARAAELLEQVGLAKRLHQRADELSGGELRMLEIGRQLMRRPRLLLLDEPTAGVNERLQDRLADLLRRFATDGMCILVVEHNLHFLLALANKVVVMHQGRILTEGTPEEIRRDRRVVAAYLGREHHVA